MRLRNAWISGLPSLDGALTLNSASNRWAEHQSNPAVACDT